MNTSNQKIRTALAGALAVSLGAAVSGSAVADDHREQCAGIVKAGMNDCATSMNACHGHVKTDAHPEAWIYVPKGTCERIVGARVVKVKDPTPKKDQQK